MTKLHMVVANLPEKLSDLIEIALHDLEIVEKLPEVYEIDMGAWHDGKGDEDRPCAVCFAGAVMAQTCKVPRNKGANPENFSEYTRNRLFALDDVRVGYVEAALDMLGIDNPPVSKRRSKRRSWLRTIPEYEEGPIAFKKALRELIVELREVQL